MTRHWPSVFVRFAILAGVLGIAPAVAAQDVTPSASSQGITLAASGMDNPRGFTWGSDGSLYVALARTIPESEQQSTPVAASQGSIGGLQGSVSRIIDRCPTVYQGSLPSSGGSGGVDLGPSDLVILNGQMYVLDEGGGSAHGNPLTPDGIYAVDGGGGARLIADIGTWIGANPVANSPATLNPGGDLFAMVASDGALWVTETNRGQLLRISLDGSISRIVDFSATHRVPTGLTVAPDGTLYVAVLDEGSFDEGAASIVSVDADGATTDVWTGLTAIATVSVAQDGTLFALQTGTGGEFVTSVTRNTGKVVRQSGPGSSTDVATGLDVPGSMAFGPDQGLYVSSPVISTGPLSGSIIRFDVNQGHVMAMSDAVLAGSQCSGPVSTTTPDASPTTGDSTPDAGSGLAVSIQDFAYGPASLTVSIGATVTWTNKDLVPHTVTASDGSFNSGAISPGDTFTYTFDSAGTFDYMCGFHPNMKATIIVQ